MANEDSLYNESEKRYFRIDSMIKVEGPFVLRKLLATLIGLKDLDTLLNQGFVKRKVDEDYRKKLIKREQYNLLNTVTLDINDLDVTLLSYLIRALHPRINSNSNVWKTPSPIDFSPEADTTRLRDMRNRWCHPGIVKLTEVEFENSYSELHGVLCRLAKHCGDSTLTFAGMSTVLENKKKSKFDPKPTCKDISTSVSSSLENFDMRNRSDIIDTQSSSQDGEEDRTANDCIQFASCETSSIDSASVRSIESSYTLMKTNKDVKDVGTSTSSLLNKRKLSFIIKTYLQPFVSSPKPVTVKDEQRDKIDLPTRKRRKSEKVKEYCETCGCCKAKPPYQLYSQLQLGVHSGSSHFCKIEAIVPVGNGRLLVSDTTHDSILVFTKEGRVICEKGLPTPTGICRDGDNIAVSLQKHGKIIIFTLCEDTLEETREISMDCHRHHYDIRSDFKYFYVLCEDGKIHLVDKSRGVFQGNIETNFQSIRSFDVDPKGKHCFISTASQIHCIDILSNIVWSYPLNHTRAKTCHNLEGVIVHKDLVFVADWGRSSILAISVRGKLISELGTGVIVSPWRIGAVDNLLFVSQYASFSFQSTCSEIVVLKKR
ncbi:uncharacterized protein LOC128212482 [Mya arenaria]|uniref:uncharacterized protein LOC128212482 n=1 Tax=Mya arenaria TaxID=6604 RepID=UPI0022E31641|nr:uncharacterized protein LOC128212482 [Mya arenaria]